MKNNKSQFGGGNYSTARRFERGAPRRAFSMEEGLENLLTIISSNQVTTRETEKMTLKAYVMVNGQQVKGIFDTSTMGDNHIS
jgi:histidyl-tRNA synthetase